MKKYLSILMTLMLMFGMVSMLGACSNDNAVAEEVSEEEDVIEETEDENESDETDLAILEEDPSAVDFKGFYLLKNDKYYPLDGEVNNDQEVGLQTANAGKLLYSNAVFYDKSNTWVFHSYEEVPELTLSNSDKVIAFSDDEIPTLSLYKVDFYGHGICASYDNGRLLAYFAGSNDYVMKEGVSDFVVREDETGEVVDDYYNLTPGVAYVLSWHKGTNYEEQFGGGYSLVYSFEPGFDASSPVREPDYRIEGTITNLGYAEYDMSNVEPGIYSLSGGIQSSGIIKVE